MFVSGGNGIHSCNIFVLRQYGPLGVFYLSNPCLEGLQFSSTAIGHDSTVPMSCSVLGHYQSIIHLDVLFWGEII